MSYTAPFIDATGPHVPTFGDVQAYLIQQYQNIAGADVYIGNDSQDIELLNVIALAFMDSVGFAMQAYAGYSPATAYGAGLSSIVKINGLARQIPTNSTAILTAVGQAGTVINNGVVRDTAGFLWNLPATVAIPLSGEIDVTATCQAIGAITAGIGSISQLAQGITAGWQSASNAAIAEPGTAVEPDIGLRIRQSVSTGMPAQSIAEGIRGALLASPGVTAAVVYENTTDMTDADGITPHSVAAIVEGGDTGAIGLAIYNRLSSGITTMGGVEVVFTDTAGVTHVVRYAAPVDVPITVGITITALDGYLTATGAAVKQALADYITGLQIGEDVRIGRLYTPANSAGSTYAVETMLAARTGPPGSSDIAIAYNERASCPVANITLAVA